MNFSVIDKFETIPTDVRKECEGLFDKYKQQLRDDYKKYSSYEYHKMYGYYSSYSRFTDIIKEEIIEIADKNPVLREGFSDLNLLKTYEKEIEGILQDAFSPVLTQNEIKTGTLVEVQLRNRAKLSSGVVVKKVDKPSFKCVDITNIQEFYYVVNDKYKGVNADSEKLLETIKQSNGLKECEFIVAKDLENMLYKLDDDQIMADKINNP